MVQSIATYYEQSIKQSFIYTQLNEKQFSLA